MPVAYQSRAVTGPQLEKARLKYNKPPQKSLEVQGFWAKRYFDNSKCPADKLVKVDSGFDKLAGGYILPLPSLIFLDRARFCNIIILFSD